MTHQLLATMILASESAEEGEPAIPAAAWAVGVGALVVFMVLLLVVTRLNLDR